MLLILDKLRTMICNFLVLMIAIGMVAAPLQLKAATEQDNFDREYQETIKYAGKIGVWSFRDSYVIKMGDKTNNAKKITVASSNKKSVTVKVIKKGKNKNNILIKPKKTGSSKITIKVTGKNGKKKKYSSRITVYKYNNPLKKFKLGRDTFTFKESDCSVFGYDDVGPDDDYVSTIKAKIAITPKSGWKVKMIKMGNKKTKNKSILKFDSEEEMDFTVTLYNKKKNLNVTYFINYEGAVGG